MLKRVENYFKAIILGKKRGFRAWCMRQLLVPPSWGYRLFMYWRNWLYDKGWMKCYTPPIPLIISVGNIVAGGTGKTPAAILIAGAFYEKYSVAILSRGYRSKAENLDTPVILCEGHGPLFPASYCGDEPYMFAWRYPQATVIVGSDRKKGSLLAAKAGAEILVLDDALQHRRLVRDLDVVVIDLNDPFGRNHFLPRGFLREDKKALKRAHCVILNHVSCPEQFKRVENQVKKYTNVPIVGAAYQVVGIRSVKGGEIPTLQGKTVGMFCSIANPEYFKRLLEGLGAWVGGEYGLPDHDEFDVTKLQEFALKCQSNGCEWLVCTEKDRVKLDEDWQFALPIIWVQVDLQIVEKAAEWNTLLENAWKERK